MAHLQAISGAAFGKRFELEKAQIVLGRHPDCDVTIEVGAVSRQHARINTEGEDYTLEDLKSRNGTFLNGQEVKAPSKLRDGDLIRICDVEYQFHTEQQESSFLTDSAAVPSDKSSFGVVFVDDEGESEAARSVSSKFDIRGSAYGSQLTTNAEMRLKAMVEITQNLGGAVKLDEVLPKVLDTLFKVFLQADRAFVVLKEADDQLVARYIKTRQEDQQDSFRISRTVMKEVMETKQAIISIDASTDERFEMAHSISDFRIRSIIVAPLLDSDGEPLGAMQMDTLDSKRHFESGDLEILASIATQAGVAIENAQLHEQAVEKQRVEQDLELATKVQQAFLPNVNPGLDGYQFYSYYHPADQIGGDYYDYIPLPDGRVAIIVADVVGHGVAAAMLMAKLSAETRFLLASENDPSVAITKLNNTIATLGVEKFVTLLCLVLDPSNGALDIVNAGHMAPIWLKPDGTVEEPGDEAAGVPIGILEDFEYDRASITVGEGDRLILYTDGINEAPDKSGEMFGISRLQNLVAEGRGALQDAGDKIVAEVKQFITGTQQADDMCLVIVGRN